MKYVIGVDLGTSAVKILLVNRLGDVVNEVSKSYPLIQDKTGYSEQNPNDWVDQTIEGLSDLLGDFDGDSEDIEGLSFSGQMHGLVLLDENNEVVRNAILWNDTRTTGECQEIYEKVGRKRLLEITKNIALEGFTLPKILWVKNNEQENFAKSKTFVLPKDYVRYRLTGQLHMDYSDAAGTLLLDANTNDWSKEICTMLNMDHALCPPLVESHEEVGCILPEVAKKTGLSSKTRVFAGGADNACGAIGAGVLQEGKTLASIGTSGVVLTYEKNSDLDFQGKVHYFKHAAEDAFYSMGVTLAAGYSLNWFKETFAENESFDSLLDEIDSISEGSRGLLFTPYLAGERTPHVDATIRGSFIGIDSSHQRKHFALAILEGITFSLNESVEIFRASGKNINEIISIGGGAKSDTWLQMQADIFNANVIKLESEQGPGMGAAMLAAYGSSWFSSLQECAKEFLKEDKVYTPNAEKVEKYRVLYSIYKDVYSATAKLSKELAEV